MSLFQNMPKYIFETKTRPIGWISDARCMCVLPFQKGGGGEFKIGWLVGIFYTFYQVLLVSSLGGSGWIIPGGKVEI